MPQLYPLLMAPMFDPRPWGTTDLAPIYPNHHFDQKIGESWLTGDNGKVANGAFKAKTLAELSKELGPELVGDAPADQHRFPLLLKFLFPAEKLSVQVHPDDEGARAIGEPNGKTECWYVAHAKSGAKIGLGLKPGVTREQFAQSIHENRAEELLNWINVFQGEMIYVTGGTVHTLGPGSVIVETQQQSDTTYRLYDYGRPRELHLELGIAAIKEKTLAGKVLRPAPKEEGRNRRSSLIAAPYFVVDLFEMKDVYPQTFETNDDSGKSSAQILVAVEGCALIESPGREPVTLTKGDAVVIPASLKEFSVRPQWTVEFLKAYVPGAALPEPATRM
ncbi:MAG: type I phosphomannose isomerase catalytic subunit [Terriglobales bacterium]|jgi:mannose-6-phosphate isomerase